MSFVFLSLFILVLLDGGASLYLLRSLLLKSEDIARQSEQVHILERIDRHLQSFASTVQLAHLQGKQISHSVIDENVTDIERLSDLYKSAGGAAASLKELRQIVDDARQAALRIVEMPSDSLRSGRTVNLHDLEMMEATQQRIQALTDRISVEHEIIEDENVPAAHSKMRMTIGFNIALVVIGTVFLLAAKRYFHRSIAFPLRQLAKKSDEIAEGKVIRRMPIASTDEIGLLIHAFNRMSEQLRQHEDKLKGLAILEERERLAGELHDSLAQDLACLRIKLIEAEQSVSGKAPVGIKDVLKDLFKIVDEAYQNLRESIFGLRALTLKNDVGLVPALRDYLGDFSSVRKIPLRLKVDDPEAIRFSPQVEIQFIRILHEALTNMVKHANASNGQVLIEHDDKNVMIIIEDDGKGFSSANVSTTSLHFGLEMMKNRAKSVGGAVTIEGSPQSGTKVTLRLPLERQHRDEEHPAFAGR